MSLSIPYPFDTPGNYAYDAGKIEVSGGKARLKLGDDLGKTLSQGFDSDLGFIYDSGKAEFTSGKCRQKSQIVDTSCGANYTTGIDLIDWSLGVKTGTAYGGATAVGGKLDLKGPGKSVDYNASLNADSRQQGCVRMKVTPDWGGIGAKHCILSICRDHLDYKNSIYIIQWHNGQMKVVIHDSTGADIVNGFLSVWSPNQGQEYEFELNWDIDIGETRLFIDGVQHGITMPGTGTRDTNINLLRVGSDVGRGILLDGEIDDLMVFDSVQHTADYIPGYAVPDYKYVESKVELPVFAYSGLGSLQAFTDLTTVEAGNILEVWNDLYWNGVAWVSSDGSYAQANSKVEIVSNIGSFPVSDTLNIDIVFDSSQTVQSEIDSLIVTYTGQIYPTDNPIIKPNGPILADDLNSFVATITETGGNAVKFTIEIDGVEKYWTGSVWADSSGYVQSNTVDEIDSNIGSLIDTGSSVKFVAYLHSDSGDSTSELDSIIITYNYFAPAPSDPNVCIVAGYLRSVSNQVIVDAKVRATLVASDFINDKNFWIPNTTKEVVTDAFGYFEIELVWSSEYEENRQYRFTAELMTGEKYIIKTVTVPDLVSVDFDELV